ncbi:MAG: 4-hydroxy-tetrahydrodipicolinate synthase, partial [Clostridia bacterium]|nr:4-hydroxy-tetrahydrodipicolinate synthase [Clostridia bacterium]
MTHKELRGVFSVLITPMNDDFQIDEKGLRANIDWQISKGIAGICVTGSTGEFVSLTKEERNLVARISVEHAAGRIPVVVGTAAATTPEAIEYTQYAERIGADGAMIINPYYSLPAPNEVVEYFRMIGEAVHIPIMAYNNPASSGVDILPETMAEIGKIKNVSYLKDASGEIRRVREIQQCTHNRIKVFNGCEDLAFEAFVLGAVGWICVAGNIVPGECQKLFDLVEAGKISEAKKHYDRLLPLLMHIEKCGKLVQVTKAAAAKVGCAAGPARYP